MASLMQLTQLLNFMLLFSFSVLALEDFTNSWVVELDPDVTETEVNDIAKAAGFINYGKVFKDKSLYEFHHPRVAKRSLGHSQYHTDNLQGHTKIRSVEQLVAKTRVKRYADLDSIFPMRDPLWQDTWYLNQAVTNDSLFDMNVMSAWERGFTGSNVVVSILDDGLEHTHPDLAENYDPVASTDLNSRDDDPMPRYTYDNENRHGTRCAGEVAAEANNTACSMGVAYDASIGGIRMLDGIVTDSVEARALSFNRDYIDVYVSSWGPSDSGRIVERPARQAATAIKEGVELGRDGKGSIFVWASGNGGRDDDSCSCDGYTSSMYTLSVSGVTESNLPPWYQEQCASTLASTYSSGSSQDRKIVTTDLRHSCTMYHTGTSAAAPLAAGLIALMLEANPNLSWRDVQYITMAAANPLPLLSQGQFRTNGVGRKYSHKFGYGLMDGGKMVDLALSWNGTAPRLRQNLASPENTSISLKDMYVGSIEVPECSTNSSDCIRHLEHVQLILNMTSSQRGRLRVKLISPSGTESIVLPTRYMDTAPGHFNMWPFMSVHFWGENPAGTWRFEISNSGKDGSLTSYQLDLYGVTTSPFTGEELEQKSDIESSKAPVTNTTEYSRLAFRSRYSMDCSALYNQVSWNVFISILNYRVKDFQTLICKTECNMTEVIAPSYTCEGNDLTVTWYTDKLFPPAITEIPDAWNCLLQIRLEPATPRIAVMAVINHYPMLISPKTNSRGEMVEVVLEEVN